MSKTHRYRATLEWTGNRGQGASDYRAYGREHVVRIEGKPDLLGSADPLFRGDPTRHNPEDLLLAALSACHMLWYLHLCAEAGINVIAYRDTAQARMTIGDDGGGRFTEVVLRPEVTIADGDATLAERLHARANALCFIANSVNFPVRHEPTIRRNGR